MGLKPCYNHNGKNCVEAGCRNDRIISDVEIHCDNLLIRQDFCVEATVGVAPPPDGVTIQQLIENTIFQYSPGVGFFPTDPVRLMTVVAQNLSNNFVDVAIQRAFAPNVDQPPVTLAEATVPPNNEVALSAPDANRLVASAEVPSRVRFFITVFYPIGPVFPVGPV